MMPIMDIVTTTPLLSKMILMMTTLFAFANMCCVANQTIAIATRCRSTCAKGKPFHTDVAWQDVENEISGWEFLPFNNRSEPNPRSPSPVKAAKAAKEKKHVAKSLGAKAKSPGAEIASTSASGGGPAHDAKIASPAAVVGEKRKSDTSAAEAESRPKRHPGKLKRDFRA